MPQWFFVEVGDGGLDIASRFWRFVIVFKENQILETDLENSGLFRSGKFGIIPVGKIRDYSGW